MKKLTILVMLLAVSLSAENNITNTLGADGSYSVVSSGASTLFKILNSNGNVGIGTSTPGHKLTVEGQGSANTGVLGIDVTGDASFTWASSAVAPNLSDGNNIIHMIGKAESEYNSGYMGFHFNESGNSDNFLTFGLHSHDNLLNITGAGNVGIGTTDPSYPLHVASFRTATNDPGYYFNSTTASLTYTGSAERTIGIYCAHNILTNNAFVAVSDLRIKENIKEIPHSLDLVRKLRPVSYNKIDKIENGGRTEFGFIAQEVEEILPEAVNTGTGEIPVLKPFDKVEFEEGVSYTILVKNGDDIKEMKFKTSDARPIGDIIVKSKSVNDFKSITYDMIFTVAVDAIQEQQGQIEALTAQNALLKTENSGIRAENVEIKKQLESLAASVEALKNTLGGLALAK
jgi:predicted DNA-binding antitoxin AbrB/MazE fold protein